MLALDLVVIILVAVFFKELLAISLDEEFSAVIGIPTNIFYIMLLVMVSLCVVLLIRIVGIILVIALLTIPAAICRQFTYNIKSIIIIFCNDRHTFQSWRRCYTNIGPYR